MNIGKKIHELRTKKNISGNKLAQLSGISQSAISAIELGKKYPTTYTLEKICDALDISLADFFKDEVKESKISIDDVVKELKGLSPSQLKAIKMSAKAMKEYKK